MSKLNEKSYKHVSGFPRDKIAAENNIGAGTVSSIVANYLIQLGS
jgi:hypothetical protein